MPGVVVEAASPALIERVRTATTDEKGQYKIIDLRPGIYTVTFTLTGFSTVKREGVEGLLSYTAQALMTTRQVRAYRDRPARQETDVSFQIDVRREETLIKEKKREMGWQVYGTNAVAMTLAQAVWAYRGQYRIEDDWSRLRRSAGLTLPATPPASA